MSEILALLIDRAETPIAVFLSDMQVCAVVFIDVSRVFGDALTTH
jgi:hypothetical protein